MAAVRIFGSTDILMKLGFRIPSFFFLYFYFSCGSVSACFATGIVCNLVNNPPFILILLENVCFEITTRYQFCLI